VYRYFRNLIFQLPPETAHHLGEIFLNGITNTPLLNSLWNRCYEVRDKRLEQNLFGVTFYNPVGIGAGFDKNGTMVSGVQSLGFGYSEIGTITPKPQKGNPKPRLYRHIKEESLQNAMGFNNDGMEVVAERISKIYPFPIPVGINIGKNKATPEDRAIDDYLTLIEKFEKYASYLVINISSPNTPNLRDLQNEKFISELFTKAKEKTDKPILLKIAPDMSDEVAIQLSKFAVESGASGIIATNTTTDYSLVSSPQPFGGGLSGSVLKEKSFRLFEAIAKELFGKTILISVGGIDSPEEAYRRLRAGASLIQIFSSLIFKGPSLPKKINLGILKFMERDGIEDIRHLIGIDRK